VSLTVIFDLFNLKIVSPLLVISVTVSLICGFYGCPIPSKLWHMGQTCGSAT